MAGEGVSGPGIEAELKSLPFEVTTWSDWSTRHPQTKVLSPETGHSRDYQRSPYTGYFASPQLMFPVKPLDRRLALKTTVLGVRGKKSRRAYPLAAFAKITGQEQRLDQELDELKFTLIYDKQASSLRIEAADDGLRWMYAFWFAWAAFHPDTEIFKQVGP